MFAGCNVGEAFDGVPIDVLFLKNPAIFISSTYSGSVLHRQKKIYVNDYCLNLLYMVC